MNETVELLRFTLPKKVSIDFSFDLLDTLIYGDSTQIQQMLINLAVNARDAMPEGERIELRVEKVELSEPQFSSMVLVSDKAKPRMFAVIRLADSGTGIEPDKLERIFEPFYTTKAPEDGTGLGLAAVAGIMKGHRGMIQVESKVGHGTTFSLFLPIHQPEAEKPPAHGVQARHGVITYSLGRLGSLGMNNYSSKAYTLEFDFRCLTALGACSEVIDPAGSRRSHCQAGPVAIHSDLHSREYRARWHLPVVPLPEERVPPWLPIE